MAMERLALSPHVDQYFPNGVWGSQASVASPTNYSPSSLALFQEGHGHNTPRSRFSPSPEYADSDPLGGFNPNLAFLHCPPSRGPPVFTIDIDAPYSSLSAYASSPPLRRGPLPFASSHADNSSHQFNGTNADTCSVLRGMIVGAYKRKLIRLHGRRVLPWALHARGNRCHGLVATQTSAPAVTPTPPPSST